MDDEELDKLNKECTGSKDIYNNNSMILLHILKELREIKELLKKRLE